MVEIPAGTITFLATDIQGSTQKWERYRDCMPAALERHDQVINEAIAAHDGQVFKNVGDGVFAAFRAAPAALQAALDAQRALFAAEWPIPEPLRVRMALHSGEAEIRGGDYFGPPVNRVARILSAGHGGQILLSQAVERLSADRFPEGVALRDLGERALKDMAGPERIFQLVIPDLPADFPPLRTLDVRPHNLPAHATPLVGREREITEVRRLLQAAAVRLVTLVGPGGIGKTRLGMQVAAEVIDDYRDGVWHVNLAPVQDPEILPSTIGQVLGLKSEGDQPALAALADHLRSRETLLLLDNFEQIVEAAPVVAELLKAAPDLVVLVTSQAALRIQGEHEYPVLPLPLPDDREDDPDRLAANEAVSLFVQRARAARPSFHLNGENARAVGALARRLDGLPLAIELAAARIKLFPPAAMLERLGHELEFLRSGDRDRPDRHRTIRAAIGWSIGLLTEEERLVFERMSVFDGGFTLEAAEAVLTTPEEGLDVVGALESLIDKSLLRQVQVSETETRFERLRTIRAYAAEMLEASGEADIWRRRHAEYFAEMAESFDPTSLDPDMPRMLDRLEREVENLRAAMEWALGWCEAHIAVRLSQALPALWFTRGSLEEGARWVERILECPGLTDPLDRAKALNLVGRLAQIRGDNSPTVVARFEESLALFREAGHRRGIARSLMNLGNVRNREGAYAEARALFEESLGIYRELGDSFGAAGALMNLGDAWWNEGERERAVSHFEKTRDLARKGGNEITYAFALQYLGAMRLEVRDLDAAEAMFEESQAIFRRLGARPGKAWSRYALAGVAAARGQPVRARALYCESLDAFDELEYRAGLALSLIGLASLESDEGRHERAARLLGAADTLRIGATISRSPLERAAESRVAEAGSAALGPDAFERERGAGRELTQAEALELAREDAGCEEEEAPAGAATVRSFPGGPA